jgi:hypothetical protein
MTCLRNSVNNTPELSVTVILQADAVDTIRSDRNSEAECDKSVADVFGVWSAPSLRRAHAVHDVDLHNMTVFATVDIVIQLLRQIIYRKSKEDIPVWSVYLYSSVHMLVVLL